MPIRETVTLDATSVDGARRRRLLTRAELAERATLSSFVVWAAHNGKPIGLKSAKKIAAALGVSVRSLLRKNDDAPASGADRAKVGGSPGDEWRIDAFGGNAEDMENE